MRCFRTIAIRFPSITERFFFYSLSVWDILFILDVIFDICAHMPMTNFEFNRRTGSFLLNYASTLENALFINLRLLIFSPSWNIMWTTNRNVHTDHLDKRNGYRVRCMRSSEWILNRALCVIRPLCLKMEYFFGQFWAVNKTILCIKIGEYTGSGKWKHTLQKNEDE